MLIIEIALGIVLGVVILSNLEAIIGLGAIAIVIAIAIGLLALLISFGTEIVSLILIALGTFFGFGILGIVAEKLFDIKKFGTTTKLTAFPKLEHDTYLYYEYFAQRIGLGAIHAIALGMIVAVLDAKKFDSYEIIAITTAIYLILACYRFIKIRSNRTISQ